MPPGYSFRAREVRAWWAGPVPLWQRLLVSVLAVAILIVLFFIGLTALTIGIGAIVVLVVIALVVAAVRRVKGGPRDFGPDEDLRSGVSIMRRNDDL